MKQLKQLFLSDYVVLSNDVENFNFFPLSGGAISGDLSIFNGNLTINSNVSIGQNNKIGDSSFYSIVGGDNSVCNGNKQISFGENCIAGAKGYKILAADELTTGIIRLSIDVTNGPISEEIVGLQHSINITNAATNVGEVISIDNTTASIFIGAYDDNILQSASVEMKISLY